MAITEYKIFGERCSGTNYLEELMKANFDIEQQVKLGSKHFFGFNSLDNTDHILFMVIVRNPIDWLNSLYKRKHHVPPHLSKSVPKFLNSEWYSIFDTPNHEKKGEEIVQDRNIYTNERYKNIFELRHIKHKYLIDDLPNLVKNYIIIKYEDLINDFNKVMQDINNKGVKIKDNINFPINITWNCKNKKQKYIFKVEPKNKPLISSNRIYKHSKFDTYYEKLLGYVN
jgi:hypothetical protein